MSYEISFVLDAPPVEITQSKVNIIHVEKMDDLIIRTNRPPKPKTTPIISNPPTVIFRKTEVAVSTTAKTPIRVPIVKVPTSVPTFKGTVIPPVISKVQTIVKVPVKVPVKTPYNSSDPTLYILKFATNITTTGPITVFMEDTIPFTHSVYGFTGFDPVFQLDLTTGTTYTVTVSYCKNCQKKRKVVVPIITDTGFRYVFTLPCIGKEQVKITLQ